MTQMTKASVATNLCLVPHWVESKEFPTIPRRIWRPQIPPSQLPVCRTFIVMSRALGCQSLNDKLKLVGCVMSLKFLSKGLPHCNVENGELGVGDLVDELCHHVEGSFLSLEGKLGAGKGCQATEGQ